MRARLRSLLLLTAVATGVFIAPLSGARGMGQPALTLGVGQTVSHKYGPILGQDVEIPFSAPSDCTGLGTAFCDDIPITLSVPKSTLVTHLYTVDATVNWQSANFNNGVVGTIGTDNFAIFFWENPPTKDSTGSLSYDTASVLVTPPTTLTIVNPKSAKLDLVVANYVGLNLGYTVTVSLYDASLTGPPVDRSIDTAVDKSVTPTGPVTSSAPPTTVTPITLPAVSAPAANPVGVPLNTVSAGPDPQLDGLKPADDTATLGLGPAKKIVHTRGAKTGPPGPVSHPELWLALLIPPVLLAVAGGYAWRRRAVDATAP